LTPPVPVHHHSAGRPPGDDPLHRPPQLDCLGRLQGALVGLPAERPPTASGNPVLLLLQMLTRHPGGRVGAGLVRLRHQNPGREPAVVGHQVETALHSDDRPPVVLHQFDRVFQVPGIAGQPVQVGHARGLNLSGPQVGEHPLPHRTDNPVHDRPVRQSNPLLLVRRRVVLLVRRADDPAVRLDVRDFVPVLPSSAFRLMLGVVGDPGVPAGQPTGDVQAVRHRGCRHASILPLTRFCPRNPTMCSQRRSPAYDSVSPSSQQVRTTAATWALRSRYGTEFG